MSRTPDERRRAQLLDAIIEYIYAHGVSSLSLRPLASAVESSPRVLLHYFGSKDALVLEALVRVGDRQRALFRELVAQRPPGVVETCRAIWTIMSAPDSEPLFRVFFEVYGLALQDRERYAAFLDRIVNPWLSFIGDPLVACGWTREQADAYATMVVAAFRGFLMDLCAARDRTRVDRSVELWLRALGTAFEASGPT